MIHYVIFVLNSIVVAILSFQWGTDYGYRKAFNGLRELIKEISDGLEKEETE